MDIKEAHIGQKVMTKTGRIGTVDAISSDSVYVMFGSSVCGERMRSSDLSPAIDSCASCEMAATITSQCKQIAELRKEIERARLKAFWEGKAECHDQISSLIQSRDSWQADAMRYARNAHYWREELFKLQREAMSECNKTPINCAGDDDRRPLEEVAKIYIQVSPDELDRILKMRD